MNHRPNEVEVQYRGGPLDGAVDSPPYLYDVIVAPPPLYGGEGATYYLVENEGRFYYDFKRGR